MATKTCLVCGTDFHPIRNKQKYCSIACRGKACSTSKQVACNQCGQQLTIIASKAANQSHYYCSRKCASDARKQLTGDLHHRFKGGNYRIPTICKICGKTFLGRANRPSIVCSQKCKNEWMSQSLTGAANPAFRGGIHIPNRGPNWSHQRNLAFKRDGGKCQICGSSRKRKWHISVHHIKPFREFDGDYLAANQLTNLITLCNRCHARVEIGKLACPLPLPISD